MNTSFINSRIVNQLTGAAIALIAVTLFSFISPGKNIQPITGDETGGGKTITAEDAQALISNFPKWKATSGQKGGYLSKLALDAMFTADPEAKGIYWYMGSNDKGETFNLIVEPGTAVENGIDQKVPSNIFVTESICPTVCGNLVK